MNFPAIFLASRSPRRRELLQQMAVDFAVITPDIDESVQAGEQPLSYVRRIAHEKAEAGLLMRGCDDRRPVLAADTAVIINGQILGKPGDDDEARHMLKQLSGQTHQVMSAVALADSRQRVSAVSVSKVTFARLTEAEIDWYLETGEGRDKAGSYAVQGLGAMFIEQISGSYSGIMGLPIRETAQLLKQMDAGQQDCEQ